jgi:metal-sulfur cluster biosynthetic enzyme
MNPSNDSPAAATPFPYSGDASLQTPVTDALRRVLDPELGLSIVDLGLVYGVDIGEGLAHVRLTMTSAGCPLSDLIFDAIDDELGQALPAGYEIEIELCWEPPWTPDRLSLQARQQLGW